MNNNSYWSLALIGKPLKAGYGKPNYFIMILIILVFIGIYYTIQS